MDPQTCGPCCWPAPAKPLLNSRGTVHGFRSAAQQPRMTEVVCTIFTGVTRLHNLLLQSLSLRSMAYGGHRWPARAPQAMAAQQDVAPDRRHHQRRVIRHTATSMRSLKLSKQARAALHEATDALFDQTELILFTHNSLSRIQFGKPDPHPLANHRPSTPTAQPRPKY